MEALQFSDGQKSPLFLFISPMTTDFLHVVIKLNVLMGLLHHEHTVESRIWFCWRPRIDAKILSYVRDYRGGHYLMKNASYRDGFYRDDSCEDSSYCSSSYKEMTF